MRHILTECVYARQVWLSCFLKLGVLADTPQLTDSWQGWWIRERKKFRKKEKRTFDTLVILVGWRLWKQRNARAFLNRRGQFSVDGLSSQIVEDWKQWKLAGLGGSSDFARVVH